MIRQKKRVYESDKDGNRYLWEVLPDMAWTNKSCFIIGGGPSLREFPFSRLKGHRTIGVNLAFTKFEPSVTFSMDSRFLKWLETERYGPAITRRFEKLNSYRVQMMTYPASFPPLVFVVPVFKNYSAGHWAFTESMRDGIGHGNNSGYAALNLAAVLGANPIYLLGFDWNKRLGLPERDPNYNPNSDLQIHYYNDIEHRGIGYVGYYENHNPDKEFKSTIKKDIKIYNVSPESNINCFEKITYEKRKNTKTSTRTAS